MWSGNTANNGKGRSEATEVISDHEYFALDQAIRAAEVRVPEQEYLAIEQAMMAAERMGQSSKRAKTSDPHGGGAKINELQRFSYDPNHAQQHQQRQQQCPPSTSAPRPAESSPRKLPSSLRDKTHWNKPEPTQGQPQQGVQILSMTFRMIGNGERFGVFLNSCRGRDALDASLRTMEDCRWDKANSVWSFLISMHDQVIRTLQSGGLGGGCFHCKVEPVHAFPLRLLGHSLRTRLREERVDEIFQNIPEHLQKKLMEFQTRGVRYVIKLNGRGLIGDEMGLGKTVQALAVAAAFKDAVPVLIICPSSLKMQWAEAIHEWLRVTENHVSIVTTGKDTKSLDNRFVIMSYDFVPKMCHLIKEKKFQMIICDEAHYIKNHKAKRSKEALPLLQQAKHVVLLTGTPALARPIELLQQLWAIHPQAVRSIKEYGDRYCSGGWVSQMYPGARYMGASNLKELHQVVTATTMIRRLKKDVLSQLPSKRRQQILLPITSAEQKQLKAMTSNLNELQDALEQNKGESIFSGQFAKRQQIVQLYLKSGEIKCRAICEYLSMLLEAEQKFLAFAHHTCVLDAMEKQLRAKKVKFIRIDGSTPSSKRQGLVQDFQEKDEVRVAVLSIKAAGVGLTLTSASLVVMAELDWTPGNLVQAEDRAHRIGQASSVNVHYLHMKGSIDDIIWQTLSTKLENVGTLLDGVEDKMDLEKETNGSAKGKSRNSSERPDKTSPATQPHQDPTQQTMENYFKQADAARQME